MRVGETDMHSGAYSAKRGDGGDEVLPEGVTDQDMMPDGGHASRRSVKGRAASNFWVDLLAFLTFLISAFSGLVLMRNPIAAYYSEADLLGRELLWGLTRYEWAHLHTHISLIFVALVAAHLIMHRRWIVRSCFRA